jgi:O-antigen/teichoic acid export membrane protein
VSQLLKRGSKYTLLLSYLGCAGLLCLGPDFIRLWMGDEYGARSGKVVIILTLGLFFSLTENIGGHLLFGLGKHRLNVWCTLGEAALNLAASIFLVRHYGIYGVAAGTGLAALVVRGWFFPNAALKVFQVRWREYLAASVLPTVIPTLAFAGGILATRHFIPVHGYGTLCLAAMGGIVAYLPFLYGMGLDAGERAQLRSRLKELFSTRFGVGVVPGVASPDWNGKTDKGL